MAEDSQLEVSKQKNTITPPTPNANMPEDSSLPTLTSGDAPVDRGPEVVATTLAPQLGSDATHLGQGRFDMRMLSVIEAKDIPFLIYARIRSKKTPVWGTIHDGFLAYQVSVGGRGRKDIIRMEGVSKGGMPDVQPDLEKPGWVERNFTDRSWKKRVQEDMM